MKEITVFACIVIVLILFLFSGACDEEEESEATDFEIDDDDSTDDDDSAADDDDADEGCEYEDDIAWAYDSCDLVLFDENDEEMTEEEAIEECDFCVGTCAAGYSPTDDCEALDMCLLQNCSE